MRTKTPEPTAGGSRNRGTGEQGMDIGVTVRSGGTRGSVPSLVDIMGNGYGKVLSSQGRFMGTDPPGGTRTGNPGPTATVKPDSGVTRAGNPREMRTGTAEPVLG